MIADLHDIVSWVFVLTCASAAALALAAHSIESLRGRHVWIAIGVAWAVVVLQTALGAALLYYALGEFSESMAAAGRIPAGPASWLPNAVFAITSGVAIWTTHDRILR